MARKVSVAVKPSTLRSTTSLSICCFTCGHADSEEFVQIGTGDAEKLDPFQQGILRIERLIEHPLVEFEPA